jgi:hypothetical protein
VVAVAVLRPKPPVAASQDAAAESESQLAG